MSPKQVTLAVAAVLFTAINLLVLAANWSISAHAKVAGMDFSRLEVDTDFRRAVREVVAEMANPTGGGISLFEAWSWMLSRAVTFLIGVA
jgi:hypothetical protein